MAGGVQMQGNRLQNVLNKQHCADCLLSCRHLTPLVSQHPVTFLELSLLLAIKKKRIFFFYCPTYNQQQYSVYLASGVNDIVYALLWLSQKSREICTLFYSTTKECITNHNSFITEIESITSSSPLHQRGWCR